MNLLWDFMTGKMKYCIYCNQWVTKYHWKRHKNSKKHKKNMEKTGNYAEYYDVWYKLQ